GDAYVAGASVLAETIRHHGNKSDTVCLIDSNVSDNGIKVLSAAFTHVVRVSLHEHELLSLSLSLPLSLSPSTPLTTSATCPVSLSRSLPLSLPLHPLTTSATCLGALSLSLSLSLYTL
ncbi:hypothetical protein KIPB_012758, partial [Kipferlia bialata]